MECVGIMERDVRLLGALDKKVSRYEAFGHWQGKEMEGSVMWVKTKGRECAVCDGRMKVIRHGELVSRAR